ncbi:hypothetical protein N836_14805 [Leptolyngbya sp. Heron Island J]|uniref:hypothetical protein n=1 Tax=Leptolyngbya sp. Heron Island J TaxID=1385935 RepID=UPI0003B97CB0|nr:hypothetical protein [Leptolyngbya sp. Heron Island J]ESA35026.1 hypothetical protein N836_14805 [Leptolyngbya sp. Heron Island J]
MTAQLSSAELQAAQDLLSSYDPTQPALVNLVQHDGDLDASFEDLVADAAGTAAYGEEKKKLKEVFLQNLRREICGDESFRTQVEEYSKKPGQAVLLTGLIVGLIDLVTLPINPALATVTVLWVLKLGIHTFCDYTEPEKPKEDTQS